MWDPLAGWEAAKASGMLRVIAVVPAATGAQVDLWVKWKSPDRPIGQKAVSREYQIEYLHADCPDLALGDQVLADVVYKVRTAPEIPEVKDGGEFRVATLTRQLVD